MSRYFAGAGQANGDPRHGARLVSAREPNGDPERDLQPTGYAAAAGQAIYMTHLYDSAMYDSAICMTYLYDSAIYMTQPSV